LWVIAAVLVLSATPLRSQTNNPFGGFKHDNTQPIEITSDSLEVRQAEELAIFTGEVIAGQGTLRLTADKLEVFYKQKQGSETGAIRNIKASGNVFLSNGAETAKGAKAEYDVVTGLVRMYGNVVLTQGENAIAGDTLFIDLNKGTGRIEAAGNGRVKSIFTPSSN